jgi:hypothetical protein
MRLSFSNHTLAFARQPGRAAGALADFQPPTNPYYDF